MGKEVAVLDIGSSKLCFAVGSKNSIGVINVSSFSCETYQGYYESEFCDFENLLDDVKRTINASRIEKMPKTLYVSVPAEFSKVDTRTSYMNFGREKLITRQIIDELHKKGDKLDQNNEWVLISSSAINYTLDEQYSTLDPLGDRATHVSATISYLYASDLFVRIFDSIAIELGIESVKYVISTWAVSSRFIDTEARKFGSLSLDIGFGSTSLALVKGDGIISQYTAPLGTGSIFDALARQLDVDFEAALELQKNVNLDFAMMEGAVYTVQSNNRIKTFKAIDINNALKARLDDIVDFIENSIDQEPGVVSDSTPVYLTGGGISGIKGSVAYLEKKLKRRVKGRVAGVNGFDKPYFTSLIALIDVAYEINENQSIWNKLFN